MTTLINIAVVLSMILTAIFPTGLKSFRINEQLVNPTPGSTKETPTATPPVTSTLSAYPPPTTEETPTPSATPTQTAVPSETIPTQTPEPPSDETADDGIRVSAKRMSFIPGEAISITWDSDQADLHKSQKIKIKMPKAWTLPDMGDITIEQSPNPDPESKDDAFVIATKPIPGERNGQLRFQTDPFAEDAIISVELWDGDVFVDSKKVVFLAISQGIVDKKGGGLEGKASGVNVKLSIEEETLQDSTTMQIQTPQQWPSTLPFNGSHPIQLNATNKKSGQQIHKFAKFIEIAIPIDSNSVSINPAKLALYWLDEETGAWRTLPGMYDSDTKTYYAKTDHFSLFALGENSWESMHVPPLDAAAVSEYTGAATYQMDFNAPAGPGGISPSISLSYNSTSVEGLTNSKYTVGQDGITHGTQPSWVGLGWNLSTGGQILRNMEGKDDDEDDSEGDDRENDDDYDIDDTFSLVIGGVSYDLVPVSAHKVNGVIDYIDYKASEENFWLIRRFKVTGTRQYWLNVNEQTSGQATSEEDYWVAWDTQGVRYEFRTPAYYVEVNQNANASIPRNCNYKKANGSYVNKVCTFRPWSWSLTYSYFATGQRLEYTYNYDTDKKYFGENFYARIDQALYPNEILYPDGKTKVRFQLDKNAQGASNRKDVIWYWGDTTTYVRYEKNRLKSVQILVDNAVAREYVMTYYANGEVPIFPLNRWTPVDPATVSGRPTDTDASLVLKSVTEYGVGGSAGGNALPAIDFKYGPVTLNGQLHNSGDQMHLSQVQNGYGGGVTFVYESTPWYDPNHIAKSKEKKLFTGPVGFNNPNDEWQIEEKAMQVMPGSAYRFACQISSSTSGSIRYEFQNIEGSSGEIAGETKSFNSGTSTVTGIISLPVSSNRATAQVQYVSGYGYNVSNCYGGPIITRYRVTARIVTDEIKTTSYTYSYQYNGASLNLPNPGGNSDDAMLAENLRSSGSEPYGEFRGHASVTVTDPASKKTTTFFHQTDALKGKIDRVEVRGSDNVLYSNREIEYDAPVVINTGLNIEVCAKKTPTAGCYQNRKVLFIGTDWEENKTYTPDGTATVGTRNDYSVDTYGNLVQNIESIWGPNGWAQARVTKYGYQPNPVHDAPSVAETKNLVGLPGSTSLFRCDGSTCEGLDHLVSYSCNIYDSPTAGGNGNCAIFADSGVIQEQKDQPDSGLVTASRTLLHFGDNANPDYATPHFADRRTQYDSMGNPIILTVFGVEGTRTALSATDPRASRQCYGVQDSPAGCQNDPFKARLLWAENPLSQRTTYQYDPTTGLPTVEIDPNGAYAYAFYDPFGRITSLILPGDISLSPTISAAYSSSSEKPAWVSVTRKGGEGSINTTRKIFDGLGRTIQTQQAGNLLDSGGKDILTDTKYDFAGRVIRQTVPVEQSIWDGSTALFRPLADTTLATANLYDSLGRIYRTTAPDSEETNTVYQFDTGSQRLNTLVTNPRGNTTLSSLDGLGQIRAVTPPTGPGTSYTYDAAGRMVSATYGTATTTVSYDLAGRKIGMVDADMGSWLYTYDAAGNLTRQRDSLQTAQVTCLYYDALNRLIGKNYQGDTVCPANPTTYTVGFAYDQTGATNSGIGRRTAMNDRSGSTQWEYDLRGRLIHEAKTVVDPQGSLSLGIYHTYWSYNSDDSVRQMVLPNMETVNYAYTPQGSLRQAYSTLNGATADVTQQYLRDTTYTAAGQVKARTLGNGSIQTYDYYDWNEQGGRLRNLTTTTAGIPGQVRQDLTYTYDSNGDILTIDDAVANENPEFEYDMLDRLTSATFGGDFEYDSEGNLSSKNGTTITYLAQALDCLDHNIPWTKKHAATAMGSDGFCYNENGNMIRRKINTVTYDLTYDEENRLVDIVGGTTDARYVYDGDGKRVLTEVNGTRTVYIGDYFEAETNGTSMSAPALTNYAMCHDSTRCNYVYLMLIFGPDATPPAPVGMTSGNFGKTSYHTHQQTPSSGVTWRTYYAGRVAMRVKTSATDNLYYMLSDHLGGTSKTITESGTVYSELRYSAWGETRYSSLIDATLPPNQRNDTPTDRRFTGQLEAEAGLYFYQARFYDSLLGRFISADLIVPVTYNPQDWDRYSYTRNNPVNATDSSGHCIDGISTFICIAVALTAVTVLLTGDTPKTLPSPPPSNANASNFGDLLRLGIDHATSANIVGEGLQDLRNDPHVIGAQNDILENIRSDPQYQKQPFEVPISDPEGFTANGPSGNWVTGARELNPSFWMVHTANLYATNTHVSTDGTISTTWKVDDQFDYLPAWGDDLRTGASYWAYNIFATFLVAPIYHGLLQAPQYQTNAYWDQVHPPDK